MGGLFFLGAALLAVVVANSPWHGTFQSVLATPMGLHVGQWQLSKSVLLWINEGLMTVFFLMLGLEIKFECLHGHLTNPKTTGLAVSAALGGLTVPAVIYALLNAQSPQTLQGWAIPCATDVAFSLSILALLGSRVNPALKALLLAIAIVDDLAAIVLLAVFYTQDLSFLALAGAMAGVGGLVWLNRHAVSRLSPYVLLGGWIWACLLKAGVHATLSGVVVALSLPDGGHPRHESWVRYGIDRLHHWVSMGIVPLFALANAGVVLSASMLAEWSNPVTLGIGLGLVIGKPLGILLGLGVVLALRLSSLPAGMGWRELLGLGCLCGIGFTMSMFIGIEAFEQQHLDMGDWVRLGVFAGSILSGLLGYLILYGSRRGSPKGLEPTS